MGSFRTRSHHAFQWSRWDPGPVPGPNPVVCHLSVPLLPTDYLHDVFDVLVGQPCVPLGSPDSEWAILNISECWRKIDIPHATRNDYDSFLPDIPIFRIPRLP